MNGPSPAGAPVPATPHPLEAARLAHAEAGARQFDQVARAARLFGGAVLIAFVIRVLLVQPFSIPSQSMAPALVAGDFIFVDKRAYGWSAASLPQGLLADGMTDARTGWRIGRRVPLRGEVVVFNGPGQVDYVKRVIGRPGDRIALQAGRVQLNGRTLPCPPRGVDRCLETLPDGRSHLVIESGRGPLATMAEIRVPAGHSFVLGDNRDRSADSRLSPDAGGVGLVADAELVGRASRIFLSVGDGIRWDRIGHAIG